MEEAIDRRWNANDDAIFQLKKCDDIEEAVTQFRSFDLNHKCERFKLRNGMHKGSG